VKKSTMVLVLFGAFVALPGCKESAPVEVVQTVEWYKANKIERANVLAKCQSNPSQLAATPNCVNASRADSASTWSAKGGGIRPIMPLTSDEINDN
jgi:hypothetical protein